jgi:O-antigen/teichoic acid export membrane protein
MKRLRATLIKNVAFNILRGSAAALAALALPHFLTRSLDPQRFAAWSLMLQIAAYATFLDFGLQTAIARFVAQAIELEQNDRRDRVVETAFVLLAFAGAIAFAVIGIVIACAAHLFHGVPASLLAEFQAAALILALGAALALPLSAYSGVLFGMHRNEFPALTLGGSRALGVVLAILAAEHTHSLIVLALCIAGTAFAGGLAQVPLAAHFMPSLRSMKLRVHRALGIELLRYCGSLTVWSLGMLIVSGLDLTVVAHFQFSAVGFYAVGGSVIALMAGFNSSIVTAFLTPQAALHARGELERLARLLRRTTQANSLLNFSLFLLAVLAGYPLLRLWVGETYAAKALPVLIILAGAQAIRLAGAPYCTMLIASGEQGKGIFSGAFEAVVNLTASLWLAHSMGYVGVAWGTLIGAVAGMAALLLYTMPRAQQIPFSTWQMLDSGLLRPILALLPMGVYTLAYAMDGSGVHPLRLVASLLASGVLAYRLR